MINGFGHREDYTLERRGVTELVFPAIPIKFAGALTEQEADLFRRALVERICNTPIRMTLSDGSVQAIHFFSY